MNLWYFTFPVSMAWHYFLSCPFKSISVPGISWCFLSSPDAIKEIEQEYTKIEEMYRRYQAEQVLLSDKSRQQREDEIIEKEKQARGMQQKRFGPEGLLFKKRQELIKPIQDKVYNAIQEYATDKNFDLIFDKSSGANIIFANPQYDKTDDILEKLGVKKDKDEEKDK